MQQQIEAIMAKEAAEANAAARRIELEAQEEERQRVAQKVWETKKKDNVKDQVNQKVLAHLQTVAAEAKTMVQSDWRDQQLLKLSKEKIRQALEVSHELVQNMEESISTVDAKTLEIQKWLDESKNSNDESIPVDDLCKPESNLHGRLLDLSSENAAITDALYFLDRGMYMGHIDCTTHLKSVRKLAKRQFLVRAHILKINQALVKDE
jgi:ESCRT-I complex subunit TSG101